MKPHVVVLVHGIRTFADWQDDLRATLREHGFIVALTNYGRFNLLKFLLPVPFFRRQAIRQIERQLAQVFERYPDADISVIAHSFGTYVIAHLLDKFAFNRVVFCGSVVRFDFDFGPLLSKFNAPLLNEVGTKDAWPAVAHSVTWGYGYAGSYGFRTPTVEDRWHAGADHAFFLTREFCERYWVPFLREGSVTPTSFTKVKQGRLVRLITALQLKWLVVIGAFTAASFAGVAWWSNTEFVPSDNLKMNAEFGLYCTRDVKLLPPTTFQVVRASLGGCIGGYAAKELTFTPIVDRDAAPLEYEYTAYYRGYDICARTYFSEDTYAILTALRESVKAADLEGVCNVKAQMFEYMRVEYLAGDSDAYQTRFFEAKYDLLSKNHSEREIRNIDVPKPEGLQLVKMPQDFRLTRDQIIDLMKHGDSEPIR